MIAVVAAIAATVGDLLLLAAAQASRPGFEWVPVPSATWLFVGTVLGVIGIPCYALGYRDVAARFASPYRGWIAGLGTAGAILGGVTHGLTGWATHVETASGMGGIDPVTLLGRYGAYLLPLWAAIAAATLVGSAAFVLGVLRGRATLVRSAALLNPAFLTLGLVLLGAASHVGRGFLVPAAPNLAHVVFFALLPALRRGRALARAA